MDPLYNCFISYRYSKFFHNHSGVTKRYCFLQTQSPKYRFSPQTVFVRCLSLWEPLGRGVCFLRDEIPSAQRHKSFFCWTPTAKDISIKLDFSDWGSKGSCALEEAESLAKQETDRVLVGSGNWQQVIQPSEAGLYRQRQNMWE